MMNSEPSAQAMQGWALVARAVSLACQAHQGQLRKDGCTPYVSHVIRVGWLLEHVFGIRDPEVLAAGVLHDVIEDTTVDYDDLQQQFGSRVADLVACLSKDKRQPEPQREAAYQQQLLAGGPDVLAIKLADLLENLNDVSCLPSAKQAEVVARFQDMFGVLAPAAHEHCPLAARLVETRLQELAR